VPADPANRLGTAGDDVEPAGQHGVLAGVEAVERRHERARLDLQLAQRGEASVEQVLQALAAQAGQLGVCPRGTSPGSMVEAVQAEGHTIGARPAQRRSLGVGERPPLASARVERVARHRCEHREQVRRSAQGVGVEDLERARPAVGVVERAVVGKLVDADQQPRVASGALAEHRLSRSGVRGGHVGQVGEAAVAHRAPLELSRDRRGDVRPADGLGDLGPVELDRQDVVRLQLGREEEPRGAPLVVRAQEPVRHAQATQYQAEKRAEQ
jgi:hypothetical protein